MSEQTQISWCDSTVNFFSGCTKVSPGCENCYAEAMSARGMGKNRPSGQTIGKWGPKAERKLHEPAFKLALRLNKKPWVCDKCGASSPVRYGLDGASCGRSVAFDHHKHEHTFCDGIPHRRRIFSLSLGDWLDPEVPVEWLAEMLDTIQRCDQVTWILCSKRPELWRGRIGDAIIHLGLHGVFDTAQWLDDWKHKACAPKNIIILTTAENQAMADKRIPELLKIPAVCRGLSCEPLLGPIDIPLRRLSANCFNEWTGAFDKAGWVNVGIDWVIVGGESGRNARPCNVDWIRSIKEQCASASVPCFVKQLGSKPAKSAMCVTGDAMMIRATRPNGSPIQSRSGSDPSEWPEDLRVRQFPNL